MLNLFKENNGGRFSSQIKLSFSVLNEPPVQLEALPPVVRDGPGHFVQDRAGRVLCARAWAPEPGR